MRTRHFIDYRLTNLRPFSAFPRPELEAITAASLPVSVDSGTILAHQGRFGDQLMIVLAGAGGTTIGGTTYGTVGPGDVLGSVAVLGNKPHLSTVTATEHMDLLAISIPGFKRLALESPSLLRAMAEDMARQLFDSEHASCRPVLWRVLHREGAELVKVRGSSVEQTHRSDATRTSSPTATRPTPAICPFTPRSPPW